MNLGASCILVIYFILLILVFIFNIGCVFYHFFNERAMKRLESRIGQLIGDEDSKRVSVGHINLMIKLLVKANYFIAFTRIIEKMKMSKALEYLRSSRRVFIKILPYYQGEGVVKQSYFVYFLSLYPCIYNDGNNEIIKYLINCTVSESIYLRENALNAIYAIGDEKYLKEAFALMNNSDIKHNHKLITNGLLKYRGDISLLVDMLIDCIKDYNENYKVACINYFSYRKIDCKESIYKILVSDDEPKEARIAAIRYFSNVIYDDVVSVFYKFIENSEDVWEYAAISAVALKNYKKKDVLNYLTEALRSSNWYVRNNAAASVVYISNRDKLKLDFSKINDKYAEEALRYQMAIQEVE